MEVGDTIIYKFESEKKTYRITVTTIIDEIDWTYLEKTSKNKITLITCVENEPTKRRCIQGEEI